MNNKEYVSFWTNRVVGNNYSFISYPKLNKDYNAYFRFSDN